MKTPQGNISARDAINSELILKKDLSKLFPVGRDLSWL